MTHKIVEGRWEDVSKQVGLGGKQVRAEIQDDKRIIIYDLANGVSSAPRHITDPQFEKLMAEMEADTVASGRLDDSREAMYTRMDGE